jgi:peptidoglycan LD-endopeptidase LytH
MLARWGLLVGVALLLAALGSTIRLVGPSTAPGVGKMPPVSTGALIIPVVGIQPAALTDTWQEAREHDTRVHQAIDIPAPGGTPVVAAMAGRVEKLFVSDRGGLTAYVRSADGGWIAYYAHLSGYSTGLVEGKVLAQGAPIGFVGDTGNAGAGNTHLHFALQHMRAGEQWYEGVPVNPYPLLARAPAPR